MTLKASKPPLFRPGDQVELSEMGRAFMPPRAVEVLEGQGGTLVVSHVWRHDEMVIAATPSDQYALYYHEIQPVNPNRVKIPRRAT